MFAWWFADYRQWFIHSESRMPFSPLAIRSCDKKNYFFAEIHATLVTHKSDFNRLKLIELLTFALHVKWFKFCFCVFSCSQLPCERAVHPLIQVKSWCNFFLLLATIFQTRLLMTFITSVCISIYILSQPMKVPNQLVGAPLSTDVTLICNVEASPKAINYWQRENGKIMNPKKYW